MKDVVDRAVDVNLFRDVVLDERESGVLDMCEVGPVAGDEVVHPDDFVIPGE